MKNKKTKIILSLIICFCINSKSGFSEKPNEPNYNLSNTKNLYIDLMKKTLSNTIYEDVNYIQDAHSKGTIPYDKDVRQNGRDHPTVAHTMIGMKRLDNIQYCIENILRENIEGDFIETGVWRGGATILMRSILKAYEDKTRKVWVADSFEGLPPPDVVKYPQDRGLNLYEVSYLSVSLEQVQNNFKKYDLLDDQVEFLKGFFCDTLENAPINKLSLLRLDGDLYQSTMEALVNLYPKLSIGGYVIIDDFGAINACAQAVNDFRSSMNITDPITWVDYSGIYWKKTQ